VPAPLPIRTDHDPAELRRLARRERDGRVSARLLAHASARSCAGVRPVAIGTATMTPAPGLLPRRASWPSRAYLPVKTSCGRYDTDDRMN
jgi:hypothetical protein